MYLINETTSLDAFEQIYTARGSQSIATYYKVFNRLFVTDFVKDWR
jgi:hypothetical protein